LTGGPLPALNKVDGVTATVNLSAPAAPGIPVASLVTSTTRSARVAAQRTQREKTTTARLREES
jgi:hypothetical protein